MSGTAGSSPAAQGVSRGARFPFTKETPVVFRLFATDVFGKPYDLPDAQAPQKGK